MPNNFQFFLKIKNHNKTDGLLKFDYIKHYERFQLKNWHDVFNIVL